MNKNLKESLQFLVGAAYTAKDAILKGVNQLKEEEVLDETTSKKVFQKKAKVVKKKLEKLTQPPKSKSSKNTA